MVLLHAVMLRLPVTMKMFNIFHLSLVRPYYGKGILGQSETNDVVRVNYSWKVICTDDDVETEECRLEKVMDCRKANDG
jgi:hypothetical protein